MKDNGKAERGNSLARNEIMSPHKMAGRLAEPSARLVNYPARPAVAPYQIINLPFMRISATGAVAE
jgi:hypothetical protein